MRQVFWEKGDEAPREYERPYLQLPNPMQYMPERRHDETSDNEDEAPRVIIIDI